MDAKFPQPRATKKSVFSKYAIGGAILAAALSIIWFPLLFFAFSNTTGIPNVPTDLKLSIRIGDYLPVYTGYMLTQESYLLQTVKYKYISEKKKANITYAMKTFLSNYGNDDIAVLPLNTNSSTKWDLPAPEWKRFNTEISEKSWITIQLKYSIMHQSATGSRVEVLKDVLKTNVKMMTEKKDSTIAKKALLQFMDRTANSTEWLEVPKIFPCYVKVTNKGVAVPQANKNKIYGDFDIGPCDLQLRLEYDDGFYWRIQFRPGRRHELDYPCIKSDHRKILMITFNDKIFQSSMIDVLLGAGVVHSNLNTVHQNLKATKPIFTFLTETQMSAPDDISYLSYPSYSIIGLYTTFVLVAAKMLRHFCGAIHQKIMFNEYPNVDNILALCNDIYVVREAQEWDLEESLFAKLMFLYRSPETMIKFTKDDS